MMEAKIKKAIALLRIVDGEISQGGFFEDQTLEVLRWSIVKGLCGFGARIEERVVVFGEFFSNKQLEDFIENPQDVRVNTKIYNFYGNPLLINSSDGLIYEAERLRKMIIAALTDSEKNGRKGIFVTEFGLIPAFPGFMSEFKFLGVAGING